MAIIMCSPMKLARVATIGVATAGLAGCINVGSNFNVFGDGNTQVTGDERAPCTDDALTTRICREYHEHTEQCITRATQDAPCDPRLFAPEPISPNYLDKSQFFACNDFKDSNRNGFLEVQEIRGGPRDTFRTDEQIYLAGWELSEKRTDVTVYDASGNKLFQKNFPGHRGGHGVIYQPFTLPAGTYTVRWEHDECGAGQWTEQARQTIHVIDCTPCNPTRPTQAPSTERYRGSGIIESIK